MKFQTHINSMRLLPPSLLCVTGFLGLWGCSTEPSSPPVTDCTVLGTCFDVSEVPDALEEDSIAPSLDSVEKDTAEPADVLPDTVLDISPPEDTETTASDTEDASSEEDSFEDIEQLAPGACWSEEDCPGLQPCEDGWCVSAPLCITETDCIGDEVCDRGLCSTSYSGCAADDDCETGVCSELLHECVSASQCNSDQECLGYEVCDNGTCVGCIQSANCPAPSMLCYNGACIEADDCTEDADCLPGRICSNGACTFPGVSPDEFEPNNTSETATEVEEEWENQPLSLSEGDVDLFIFSVPAGQALVLQVDFLGSLGERNVTLWDGTESHIMAQSSGSASYAALSAPTSNINRSYVLSVEQIKGVSSSYLISSWLPAFNACVEDGVDQAAGNNQPGESTPLEEATHVPTGTVCGGNADWYLWDIPENGTGLLSLEYASGLADLRVRLYDQSISLVTEAIPLDDALNIFAENLVGGIHYVQVDSPNQTHAPYTLTAQAYPAGSCSVDNWELNNSPVSAAMLGNGTYSLTLCPGDEDWFALSGEADMGVLANLAYSNVNSQLTLELYDATGKEVLISNGGSAFPKGEVTQPISWGSVGSSAAFLRVFRSSDGEVSTFTPYTLEIEIVDAFCLDDQYEENDTAETATDALTFLGLYQEGIACEGDLDWFKVEVDSNQVVSLDLLRLSDAPNPDLLLLQSDGLGALAGAEPANAYGLGNHASFFTNDIDTGAENLLYAMVAEGQGDNYRLTTHVYDVPNDCLDDGYEPNNTLLGAIQLPASGIIEGSFCPSNPDFFAVTGGAQETAEQLTLTIPETNQKVTVEWLDGKGQSLGTWILNESGSVPLTMTPAYEGPMFIQVLSPYPTTYTLSVGD